MIQYGDITKLSGYELEPVDLIVGGSPCQDLSVAGKRAGLDGARSGLFLEMIRIIREMRKATNGIYPRFTLWENVPGAFSSNEGRDFSVVLGEFARLIEPTAPDVPVPQTGWSKSGVLLVGDGQIAWRTHDAQYWGVPQRRKRIALVADLRGQSAAEILFERKGVSGNIEQGETQRKGSAGTAENSIGETEDKSFTLNTIDRPAVYAPSVHHGCKEFQDVAETVRAISGTGGNNQPLVIEMQSTKNTIIENGICPTMTARMGTGGNQVNAVMTMQGFGDYVESDKASSCKQRDYKDATDLVCRTGTVRRLTPMECERLQGYPDGWTDIPGASDSARYKAIGNSIALPFWEFLAHRFVDIGDVKTIGSLFDGIGGFPLVFKRAGAETKWTSEIEPFCEKVVKYHMDRGNL